MAQPTDEEMFAWHEQDRALASAMTNEEFLGSLLSLIGGICIGRIFPDSYSLMISMSFGAIVGVYVVSKLNN